MTHIRPFPSLSRQDAAVAGGKGASLGEMTQAGIPVPPGFVVTAEAFAVFLAASNLSQEVEATLASVDHRAIHTVEVASERIRGLITAAEVPGGIAAEIRVAHRELNAPLVAVRSSATAEDGAEHAWAGQLESYLNVGEGDLLARVRACWSSLFTPRAIYYRCEKGLQKCDISVAVVVQAMVDSEKSGIAFSVHPITEDRDQMIIEAGFGLGEAIVSGEVTPDSYVVSKSRRAVLEENVGHQAKALFRDPASPTGNAWRNLSEAEATARVLADDEVLALADIVAKIESHYGFPCDVEWARAGGKFYVVQSRPITTLKK